MFQQPHSFGENLMDNIDDLIRRLDLANDKVAFRKNFHDKNYEKDDIASILDLYNQACGVIAVFNTIPGLLDNDIFRKAYIKIEFDIKGPLEYFLIEHLTTKER